MKLRFLIIALFALCLLTKESLAVDYITSNSCTTSGSSACNVNGCFVCNGTTWVPQAMIFGSATTCDSGHAGLLQWTGTSFQGCDGSAWKIMASSTCDNTSANLNLGDLTNLTVNTLTTSSIVLVTGMDTSCPVTVGVSGTGGNPEYRVCSDASCSTVTTNWTNANNSLDMQGKYIQLRATSSASVAASYTITIAVGTTNSSWTISTGMSGCSPAGTVCSDGTIYAGLSGASTPMYVTPCDVGQTGTQGACTGTRTGMPWNNGNNTGYTTTSVTGTTDGQGNTNTIITLDSDSIVAGTQLHQAAQYCADLTAYGHSDWYLPAINELNTLYTNKTAIGGFDTSGTYYWSSTEYANSSAYYQRFSDGNYPAIGKNNNYLVRCARR